MTILKEALIALNDWVEAKNPANHIFREECDISMNINNYALEEVGDDSCYMLRELNFLLFQEGFINPYPFNKDQCDWESEMLSGNFYKNQARCDWIKKHGTREKVITPEVLELAEIIYENPLGSNDKIPANLDPDSIDVTVEEGKYRFRYVDGKLEASTDTESVG